jgi:hypothetical protein
MDKTKDTEVDTFKAALIKKFAGIEMECLRRSYAKYDVLDQVTVMRAMPGFIWELRKTLGSAKTFNLFLTWLWWLKDEKMIVEYYDRFIRYAHHRYSTPIQFTEAHRLPLDDERVHMHYRLLCAEKLVEQLALRLEKVEQELKITTSMAELGTQAYNATAGIRRQIVADHNSGYTYASIFNQLSYYERIGT